MTLINYIRHLFNILMSRLTLYAEGIIGGRWSGFRRKRSSIDFIFCFQQTIENILQ
jgi:hypothetical protein